MIWESRDLAQLTHTWRGRELAASISRAEFEEASKELLQRLRRPIERALADAQPRRERPLGGRAGGRCDAHAHDPPARHAPLPAPAAAHLDPDLAVALGAACRPGSARDAALDDVVLTDVMPYSLGIITSTQIGERQVDDRFSPLIERNTPVPVSRTATSTPWSTSSE